MAFRRNWINMSSLNRFSVVLAYVVYLSSPIPAMAAWPTYLGDAGRTGVSAEPLRDAARFREQWVYRAPAAPVPAWPPPQEGYNELPKLLFDDALYVASDGNSVYFGSSVDHKVYALDAATGAVRWEFFTDAPVRFAPTLADGRVYTGSDDGYVYCLAAADGELLWKIRGGPADRRLLGHGRMMSLWPIRTGVIVKDGIAYFGAGLFRYHGLVIHAVDATSGEEVWRNANPADRSQFSMQGYMLADDEHLVFPSGRHMAGVFRRSDGSHLNEIPTVGKGMAAGVHGMIVNGLFFSGTQSILHGFDLKVNAQRVSWPDAKLLRVTGDTFYILTGQSPYYRLRPTRAVTPEIRAIDRAKLSNQGANNQAAINASTRWRFRNAGLDSLIVAGDTPLAGGGSGDALRSLVGEISRSETVVIAGGNNRVWIFNAADGRELWTAEVDGRAAGLAWDGHRLLVSTDSGAIYSFGASMPRPAPRPTPPTPPRPNTGPAGLLAQALLDEAGTRQGYALVAGAGASHLAMELLLRSDLYLIALEPDEDQAQRARKTFDEAGLYGTRIVIDSGYETLEQYPDYFANLVVVPEQQNRAAIEALSTAASAHPEYEVASSRIRNGAANRYPAPPAEDLLRVVRPYGGILLAATTDDPETWRRLTRGALEGAAAWTHQNANPGNTASSDDHLVQGRLEVLWFGEPGPNEVVQRHDRSPAPLVKNGRVFFQGFEYHGPDDPRNVQFSNGREYIGCFDAYNGTRYWTRDLVNVQRWRMSNDAGNMAVTDDGFFVAAGSKAYRLDVVTGEIRNTYEAPRAANGDTREWSMLATANGLLFGSLASGKDFLSEAVFAFDPDNGRQLWIHRSGEIRNNTIVVHDGRMVFAELPADSNANDDAALERARRLGTDATEQATSGYIRRITALDAATGQVVWQRDADLTNCGPWGSQLLAMAYDGMIVFSGAYSHYGRRSGNEDQRRAKALSVATGETVWNEAIGNISRPLIMNGVLVAEPWTYDFKTGHQRTDASGSPLRLNQRSGGCGPRSASANMTFYRIGRHTGWNTLDGGSGNFIGIRPGCWINIVPAGGVAVQLEASSGCSCQHFSLQSTLVYKPR